MGLGTGVSLLGRVTGNGLLGVLRAGVVMGCKSATRTVCITANAGVFLDLFAPGTPDSCMAHLTEILFPEVMLFVF